MQNALRSIIYGWKTRRAWWYIASAKTRDRFARTAIGSFWLGLSNLLAVLVLGTVYSTIFSVENPKEYFLYIAIGITIWNALSASVSNSVNVFGAYKSRIKNTGEDLIFFTLEEWAFQVQSSGQSLLIVILVTSLIKPVLILNCLGLGALTLVNIMLFMWWMPTILAIAGSRYEDFYQLIPIVLQISFLVSPILYTTSALGKWTWIAKVNLLYMTTDMARTAILVGELDIRLFLLMLSANIGMCYLVAILLSDWRKRLPFLI